MRQVALSIEVTGTEMNAGNRIVELACVELADCQVTGQSFHSYLNPRREIDPEMQRVHGLSSAFLANKPKFSDIAGQLVDFIRSAELIAHYSQFDISFLNNELCLAGLPAVEIVCADVIDTLEVAVSTHPGMRNSLKALCERYRIDLTGGPEFGALLDATALARVYLKLTGRPRLVH